ncbi:MAG: tRNA (adenine-N1)-methyltransferase [Candidatus Methanomethyliaceae archaeon]|nr:tRNA (adenine-N1)-methyltransferase [Candidatus Methanomethyliaceae archaeon]MDW7970935.1 tRNA (adenine-N1)-methyltransferase [Nitrososphaerota archaeon]
MIKEGDDILLYFSERSSWLLKAERGKSFHTHKGIINLDDILGKPYGSEVRTSLGDVLKVLPADYLDYLERMIRRTQVIYPKDMGYICLMANIHPGSKVVECGTGSGVLTAYIANLVRPDGRVFTYEVRKEFQEIARKNIEKLGLEKYVEFKLKDITQGIDERNMDAIILDMATPWLVIEEAKNALRVGGRLVSFSPTINQVEKTVEAMRTSGFINIRAEEIILRRYKVKSNETRPETLMIAHTGYIVSGRRG